MQEAGGLRGIAHKELSKALVKQVWAVEARQSWHEKHPKPTPAPQRLLYAFQGWISGFSPGVFGMVLW